MPARISAILAVATATAGWAQDQPATPLPAADAAARELSAMRAAVEQGEALSLAEILPSVMAVRPGKVIEVHFQQRDDGPVYVLYSLAPDWDLLVLVVDARTGEILESPVGTPFTAKDQS